ncbi:DNA-processing protein DprA (plasmid) [Arthrobacter sp. G.S.26]|uniref:DNA-processing protein DprA n=1 Tax=Arthrobacter sp. G.S.26 TaxID=3433706 RepID=UPI003D7738D8
MNITGDRTARAALTRLFEPADRVVAAIVGQLGAYAAFRLLTGQQAPHALKGVTPEELTAAVARAAQHYAGDIDPQKDLDDAAAMGGGFLIPGDEHWPAGVDDLEVPPLGLWFRGNLTTGIPAIEKCVTLTGSRDCTAYGAAIAGDFAHSLAQRGITVISGLAYGVDAVSHKSALAGGTPEAMPTIAVVARGVDRFYPSGNADLGRALLGTGLMLSETPAGTAPTRHRFIQRGRIMAALSGAVCVVEARYRSGALNTAHHAETIARHVAVVPGPVTSANSAGCHRLARDGSAVLVTEANELMELLTS